MKDYLPEACPHGDSMILDSEVLMVDLKTGNPLPFGTLGIHKVCVCVIMYHIDRYNLCFRNQHSRMQFLVCLYSTLSTSTVEVYWKGMSVCTCKLGCAVTWV